VMLVHPEAMHAYLVGRTFIELRHLVVAAHQEFAARDSCHTQRSSLAVAVYDTNRGGAVEGTDGPGYRAGLSCALRH
jgi:hypothetical protein